MRQATCPLSFVYYEKASHFAIMLESMLKGRLANMKIGG